MTEAEYDAVIAELDDLLDEEPGPGSDAARRILELSNAAEAHEAAHHEPMREPTDAEMSTFLAELDPTS